MARAALGRTAVVAVAIVAGSAASAWVGAGVVARSAIVRRLPALDVTALSPPVRSAVEAADADARSQPSAATVGALGQAYHAAQRPANALAAYGVAAQLDRASVRWTYLQAVLLDERGSADAIDLLRQVVAGDPAFGLAWLRLADLAARHGREAEARDAYARAQDAPAQAAFQPVGVASRQTWPVSAYAATGLARLDLDAGRRAEAADRVHAVLAATPTFVPARTLAALAAGGDHGEAAAHPRAPGSYVPPADPFVDAVVAQSVDADVLLKHAGLAARAGDAAWREFLVRRAQTFHPGDPNVLLELAATLQARGALEEALIALKRHETLSPDDHHGLVQQGRVLTDLGRFADAEAVLRRAANVRDAAAEYNLAVVLDRTGRADEAREHYQGALGIDPFHARAMNNLGILRDRVGAPAEALQWFRRALAIDTDAAEFHVNAGSALIHLRRFDEAVATLRTATTIDPRSADGFNNLGIALASRGDLSGARDALTQAVALAPGHPSARENLARVTAALGH